MSPEGLAALAAAIRGRPEFLLASRRYLAEFIAWRAGIGVINKVVSNLARERRDVGGFLKRGLVMRIAVLGNAGGIVDLPSDGARLRKNRAPGLGVGVGVLRFAFIEEA